MPVIDAHQHFWDRRNTQFDYTWQDAEPLAPICRNFMPPDLQPHLVHAGVDYTVFVQTQHNLAENRWILGLADNYPFIVGVVGWVDLASPAVADQLAEFKDHDKFVGIRHIVQDEPNDDFIIRPDILRGLKVLQKQGIPYDLLFYVKHLRHAATVARHVPDLPLVIDHLSKPRIKDHAIDDWLPYLKTAAECDNVYCKLSGMITEADWRKWTADDLKPYVHAALDAFGPERCMYGSDWPVCELAGTYQQVYEAINTALGPISDRERAMIFGETAVNFYNLTLPE